MNTLTDQAINIIVVGRYKS